MRLLLLNNNPAVSRLIKLSVDKVGYEMDEFEEYALVPLKSYDLIMVDNESYDAEELQTLCEHSGCGYTIYICQRGSQKPDFMDVSLEKPFLPTDFLTLLERVKNVIESQKPQEPLETPAMDQKFDIDTIEAFGVDGTSDDEISTFDELSLDDEPLMDLKIDEDEDEEETEPFAMPIFDLDAKEEDDLDATFMKSSDQEDDESEKLSLGEFDFDEIEPKEDVPSVEEESTPCILDRDDINEVKQLLDESDEEEEKAELLSFEEPLLEEEEEETEVALALEEDDENLLDDILMSEEPEEMLLEEAALDEPLEEEMALEPVEELVETQEDLIDDFQEEIEEKIEDERIEPSVLVEMDTLHATSFASLDDLNENAIKRAFGEEVEDEIFEEETVEKPEHVEVIRGEIESSIAKSISSLAQSDILKEALKGMRINISITFDEKN